MNNRSKTTVSELRAPFMAAAGMPIKVNLRPPPWAAWRRRKIVALPPAGLKSEKCRTDRLKNEKTRMKLREIFRNERKLQRTVENCREL
jgi:hypothetical protein